MGKPTEHELFEWLLEQRLLHDVGLLAPDKVAALNEKTPGWDAKLSSNEIAAALEADNRDLNRAFESWWNLSKMSDNSMTFAEIRAKAEREMKADSEATDSNNL